MSKTRGSEKRRADAVVRCSQRARSLLLHRAAETGTTPAQIIDAALSGSAPPRGKGGGVRLPVSRRTYMRAAEEAERRGCTVEALIADLLPTSRHAIGACRYCERVCRNPTDRHRWHEAACVLYDPDKGLKVRKKR